VLKAGVQLSLLLAGVLLLYVLLRSETVLSPAPGAVQAVDPVQTYLVDSVAHQFGENGVLEEILVAPLINYHGESNRSELVTPALWRFGPDGRYWQAWADGGELFHSGELLLLRGNTVLRREPMATELYTEELWIDGNEQRTRSDVPVLLVEDRRHTRALQMEMDLRTGETELRNQVESIYEP